MKALEFSYKSPSATGNTSDSLPTSSTTAVKATESLIKPANKPKSDYFTKPAGASGGHSAYFLWKQANRSQIMLNHPWLKHDRTQYAKKANEIWQALDPEIKMVSITVAFN